MPCLATTRRRRASRPKANSTRITLASTQTLPVRLPTLQLSAPCQSFHAPWPKGTPSRWRSQGTPSRWRSLVTTRTCRAGRGGSRGGSVHENGTSVALVHTNGLSDVNFRTVRWPRCFARYTQILAAIFIYLLCFELGCIATTPTRGLCYFKLPRYLLTSMSISSLRPGWLSVLDCPTRHRSLHALAAKLPSTLGPFRTRSNPTLAQP